jgi:hypothetical protein
MMKKHKLIMLLLELYYRSTNHYIIKYKNSTKNVLNLFNLYLTIINTKIF